MTDYIDRAGLRVSPLLTDFIESEVLPGLDIEASAFWESMANVIDDLSPVNKQLLLERDEIQAKLDAWNLRGGTICGCL